MVATNHAPLLQRKESDLRAGEPEGYSRDLLARAKAGDSGAFARLFDLYAERVFDYMYFHVGNPTEAEDLTARVFLKAWRNIACCQPDTEPFSVWLYLTARKAVLDYSRSQRGASPVKEILTRDDEGLGVFESTEPCDSD